MPNGSDLNEVCFTSMNTNDIFLLMYHFDNAIRLRNRFAFAVICCLIYHWLEVSR